MELQPCAPGDWDGPTGLYAKLFDLVQRRQTDNAVRASAQRSYRPWLIAVASGEAETLGPEP